MKFIIFISDIIRHGQFPRLANFRHNRVLDKYLYLGRELSVDEFNEASKVVFNPEFRNEGFTLRPAVISEDDAQAIISERETREAFEKAQAEAEAKAAQEEAERLAAEAAAAEEPAEAEAADSPQWVAPKPGTEYVAAVDPSSEESAAAEADAVTETESPEEEESAPDAAEAAAEEPAAEAPIFRLDGKKIFNGDTHIAGLFGDEKQLRVMAAHADLRPAIEEWLAANPAQ